MCCNANRDISKTATKKMGDTVAETLVFVAYIQVTENFNKRPQWLCSGLTRNELLCSRNLANYNSTKTRSQL